MYLNEEIAAEVLKLNPFPEKGFIDEDVAQRQFQVILKGFNHLYQPGNNFLYIADEVGLGKTYIAIGIASLFRCFASDPAKHIDAIIVPKQNLQYKWQKEINNFITNNYQLRDNRVRSIIDKPVAMLNQRSILTRLKPLKNLDYSYVIMRNPSFSLASFGEKGDTTWIERLKDRLPLEQAKMFQEVAKKFKGDDTIIKRAFAYLLNTLMPDVDLLIVDEAHNFKHGVNDSVSIRNQVVSRLFGACDEDEELFSAFAELKNQIQPKVKKLLLLSATPIDSSLSEIGNQLDCFLKDHQFKHIAEPEEQVTSINQELNRFMIRGVMHLSIGGQKFSRNGYRHEHRNGNVTMTEQAEPQVLNDDRTAAFLGLLQYKTIKELKLKNNNSFEMGMLAGFESFAGNSEYEKSTVEDKTQRVPKDENIIEGLVASYNKTFDEYPPHPKQESLVNELLNLIIQRQKAVVFVRRIASVREIERKLFQKYSLYLIEKVRRVKGRKKIPALDVLLKSFEDEKIRQEIEIVFSAVSDRLYPFLKTELYRFYSGDNGQEQAPLKEILRAEIMELYDSLIDNEEFRIFRNGIKQHVGLRRIKQGLKETTSQLLYKKWNKEFIIDSEDDELYSSENETEEKAPYFFQRFFFNEGKSFKKRSYNKNWYDVNYLLLNDCFDLFILDCENLQKAPDLSQIKTESKKFEICQRRVEQAIKSKRKLSCDIDEVYRTDTFMTVLMTELCRTQFISWINNHKSLINDGQYSAFFEHLVNLIEILKGVFRQGSGLLPAFIADAKSKAVSSSFINEMKILLSKEFDFVLTEVKEIILDYERLIQINFDDANRIRYTLVQQLPVSGVSGHHNRNVRKAATQFRMPGYPYVLIATDILKEGEDLHTYCQRIYHYGIAGNPSDMEQRTGRIDRIGSLTYKNINTIPVNSSGIPFQSKLQVFFPYLVDTLEVNQMIKLFNGIAEFINIFYNDISKGIVKNAKTDVDKLVVDIPKQASGLLVSKYDYQDFYLECDKTNLLELGKHVGENRETLIDSLKKIYNCLVDGSYTFLIEPEFDENRLIVSGVIKIMDDANSTYRNGPFRVYFDHGDIPGQFVLIMESCLGKIQVFGRKVNKTLIAERLSNDMGLIEKNNEVWTKQMKNDWQDTDKVIGQLMHLVCLTDQLEEEIAGDDLVVDF